MIQSFHLLKLNNVEARSRLSSTETQKCRDMIQAFRLLQIYRTSVY